MKLSRRTRYGMRLMLELAVHYGKKPLSVSQIAGLEDISPKFLGQIIIPLKAAGLIQSTRGAQGGYELARAPAAITALDVVRVLEGECFVTECVPVPEDCGRSGKCVAREIWAGLAAVVEATLASLDLASLADKARRLEESGSPAYQI